MINFSLLQKGWSKKFKDMLSNASSELMISSPYISIAGIGFLLDNLETDFKTSGRINLLTDLSPMNIYQGATDPNAINLLFGNVNRIGLWHLPSLHAKVYLSDNQAIVTSGNLTSGGLFRNFEYGISIHDSDIVCSIKNDLVSYSTLGAKITYKEILAFCELSKKLKTTYQQQKINIKTEITNKVEQILKKFQDKLIRLRLAEGDPHYIFEKTVLYLLNKYGFLNTKDMHRMIEEIHPDLCDNSVDRVIDGKRYGKKWKHAVRTSQQHLKNKNKIYLKNGNWYLHSTSQSD